MAHGCRRRRHQRLDSLVGPTHLRSSVCLWVQHAFSTSTLHITEPRRERERERESVGSKRGMEDGNQREEKKRMRLRGRRVEAAEVKCRE